MRSGRSGMIERSEVISWLSLWVTAAPKRSEVLA
jgi:hypothetical protein